VEDLSDIEREEQLRRWWSENWAWIIGGIALGLVLLAGWQYWQRHRVQAAERDEAGYVAVLEALARNQRDEAASQAKALRERKPDSPYADQAELALARSALERRDLDGAPPCCAAWRTARRTRSCGKSRGCASPGCWWSRASTTTRWRCSTRRPAAPSRRWFTSCVATRSREGRCLRGAQGVRGRSRRRRGGRQPRPRVRGAEARRAAGGVRAPAGPAPAAPAATGEPAK